MKKLCLFLVLLYTLAAQPQWAGAHEVPDSVTYKTQISSESEPGVKLRIYGTVYENDGVAPAKDVIVYVYHTNVEGVYPKTGKERGNGKRHGYLRGWMKTNSDGKYEFMTIRPAPYETHGGEPAHIHYTIKPPNESEYWLSALWFEDDERVTEKYRDSVKRSGGFNNIIKLTLNENGVLEGKRDIKLEKF